MGLAAAYQLALDGYQPVIFEAEDRIGGMAAAFDFSGLSIERFYHFYCVWDTAFLGILDELGLADKFHWVETKMAYWHRCRLQPWGDPVALLNFRGLSLPDKLRYGLHTFLAIRRSNWRPLDKLRAVPWLQKGVGAKAYDVLWRPLLDLKFYDLAQDVSAAWLWARVRKIGRSRYSLFREKLGYLEGGAETLLDAMESCVIAQGGEVHVGSPVSRVVIEARAVRAIQIRGEIVSFDKVISTVPLPYVPQLLPDLRSDVLERYRSVQNIAIVCVIVKLRRSLSGNFWININDPEMDIAGLVEYSNLRPLDHPIVYVPFYLPGDHPKFKDSDEVFASKVRGYLKRIKPALRDEDFLDLHVSRYRYAQPICGPGFLDRLPPIGLPVKGLWVADTSYYYPEDRSISESVALGRRMAKMAEHG
jgi:protoporphyrinogen oxidase